MPEMLHRCRWALAVALLFTSWGPASAQIPPVSGFPPALKVPVQVELITMGPGPTLFARFGHAALRVRRSNGFDRVYNFGYTRFDNPGLVWDFLRGEALFWADASTWPATVDNYLRDDRTIYRQVLALSPAQAEALAKILERSIGPRSRYVYDHFDDNCATRLRDLVDQVVGGVVKRELTKRKTKGTFRDAVRRGFAGRLPILLGADYVMGRAVDEPITLWQASFLPDQLRHALTVVKVHGEPLAGEAIVVYRRRAPPVAGGDPNAGEHLVWFFAMMLVLFGGWGTLSLRRGGRGAGASVALLGLTTLLLSLVPWTLLLVARLPDLAYSELTLLFWPTDLLLLGLAVRLLRRRFYAGPVLRGYLALRVCVVALALLGRGVGIFRQPVAWIIVALICLGLCWMIVRALPRRAVFEEELARRDEAAPAEDGTAPPEDQAE